MYAIQFGLILIIIAFILVWLGLAKWFKRIGDKANKFVKPFKRDTYNNEEESDYE